MLKKRYRLCLEYEVEVKDYSDIPVLRNEWADDTPGEYIVERLSCVKQLLAKLKENPQVLETYLKYHLISVIEAESFDVEELAARLGIPLDSHEILMPVLEVLDDKTKLHFAKAKSNEGEYESLIPFWEAFKERLVGVRLEETGYKKMGKFNFYLRISLFTIVLALTSSTVQAEELIILSMNTEFFFDHEPPHGQVVGSPNGPSVPTEQEWSDKAKTIAKKIDSTYANIVGLIEVENKRVVEEVKANLHNPASWNVFFEEGRDTFTGQDVALLTKYPAIQESITNFPDEREVYFQNDEEESTNPSKILAATIVVEDMDFYIIVPHLISRRRENDAKRLAQANVIRRHAVIAMMKNQNVIVMGDMNDTPKTPVLKRLRGLDDIWQDLIQTANEVPVDERYTYIYHEEKNLLDHILLSPSLYKYFRKVPREKRCKIIGLEGISDHRGVLARVLVE